MHFIRGENMGKKEEKQKCLKHSGNTVNSFLGRLIEIVPIKILSGFCYTDSHFNFLTEY